MVLKKLPIIWLHIVRQMLKKIFGQFGTGSVTGAIEYNTGPHDHKRRERPSEPIVLYGDADRLKSVCDNMTQKNKFVSGGMYFEEKLDRERVDQHIKEFIEDRFPGINPECLEMMFILHEDHNRTEINFIIAKVDLETGKAVNPFPPPRAPKFEDDFDAFRDFINEKYGYSRPDDLKNLHRGELDHRFEKFGEKFKEKHMKRNELVKEITELVANEHALNGNIPSRDDVVKTLEQLEEFGIKIEKKSEKFISISVEEQDKNIRLKGNFYDQRNYEDSGFNFENPSKKARPRAERERDFRASIERVNEIREKRANYNAERLGAIEPVALLDVEREIQSYRENQLNNRQGLGSSSEREQTIEHASNEVDQSVREEAGTERELNNHKPEAEQDHQPMGNLDGISSRNSANRGADTTISLDAGSFIGIGHENETALAKANRFQRWFDEAKHQQDKLNRAMGLARQSIENFKNDTRKKISSLTADFFNFARRSIPVLAEINKQLVREKCNLYETQQRVNDITNRARKANEEYRERTVERQTRNEFDDSAKQGYEQNIRANLELIEETTTREREVFELEREQKRREQINLGISIVEGIRRGVILSFGQVRAIEETHLAKKNQKQEEGNVKTLDRGKEEGNKWKQEQKKAHDIRWGRHLERENRTDEEFYGSLPEHQKKWYFDPSKEFSKLPNFDNKKCPSCLKSDCNCGIKINNKNKKK